MHHTFSPERKISFFKDGKNPKEFSVNSFFFPQNHTKNDFLF